MQPTSQNAQERDTCGVAHASSQGIPSAFSVQEVLPLCPSAAFSGLLLVGGGVDSRSRQEHAEGARGVSAFQAQILDDPADGSVGAMGRPSADDGDGRDHLRALPATVGRRAVSYR